MIRIINYLEIEPIATIKTIPAQSIAPIYTLLTAQVLRVPKRKSTIYIALCHEVLIPKVPYLQQCYTIMQSHRKLQSTSSTSFVSIPSCQCNTNR